MPPPSELHVRRSGTGRRVLLQATNRLVNVGDGPMEIRGRRTGNRVMAEVVQIIDTAGRARRRFESSGRLRFTFIPGQYGYWKFENAAYFELWKLDRRGRRVAKERLGPKQNYCLRDYERVRRYARRLGYGACKQNPRLRSVKLGTSRGWSDTYFYRYAGSNHIDITGLRGCYAFDHVADPLGGMIEKREDNNVGTRVVRLPYRPGAPGCPRRAEPRPSPSS